jgi:MoxR-like ATPase
MKTDRYRGKGLPPDNDESRRYPYLADHRLAEVVNMAIVLERPLLLKGPAGCGKTRLAGSIAHELGVPLHEWFIKSSSRARDGLYIIDMVRRLQDAHMKRRRAQRLEPYLRFGPLGEALRADTESVVLIDEIDKADIDFPNDLLRELDEKKFGIEELDPAETTAGRLRHTYVSKRSPIIVITSNAEKELPDAFLRRCLFYYIRFPDKAQLIEIVKLNTSGLDIDEGLIKKAVERLDQMRKIGGFRKDPATSELIDWVRILYHWGVDVSKLGDAVKLTGLPHWQMLLKDDQDIARVEREEKPVG